MGYYNGAIPLIEFGTIMSLGCPSIHKVVMAGALLVLLLVIACASEPAPTATPVPTATPAPTATATPSPTATPPPTPTATPEPETAAVALLGESLLPEGAAFIFDFNPAAVLSSSSSLIATLLAASTGDTEGDISMASIAEDFRQDTGIDLYAVDHAEMYLSLNMLLDPGTGMAAEEADFGVALYGEFDEDKIVAGFEDSGEGSEVEISTYLGNSIYVLHDDFGGSSALAVIGPDAVLYGTETGVHAMLDVAAGAAPSVSDELRQILDSLGERHIGIVMEMPPEYFDMLNMTGGGDAQSQMGLLGALDMSAMTAPVSAVKALLGDEALEIESRSYFDDNESATASREYSGGIVAMFGMMAGSPELQDFASGMEVSQSGNVVTFKMDITPQAIDGLFAGMGVLPGQN